MRDEWRKIGPLAYQNGQDVAGELAQPTHQEVPLVPWPADPSGMIVPGELRQHGLESPHPVPGADGRGVPV
jgi:hypothetical protein